MPPISLVGGEGQPRRRRGARRARSGRTAGAAGRRAGARCRRSSPRPARARAATPTASAGPSDRLLELVGRERRHGLGPRREQLTEARVDQRAVEEVGAQGDDDAEPARRDRAAATRKDSRNRSRSARRVVSVKTSSNWSTTKHDLGAREGPGGRRPSSRPREPDSSTSRSRGSACTAMRPQRGLELVERVCARATSRPRSVAPGRPGRQRRIAGTSPARTTDDFPPRSARRRPGTASRARLRRACSTRRRVSSLRPKKSRASASLNGRRPLYGLRASAGAAAETTGPTRRRASGRASSSASISDRRGLRLVERARPARTSFAGSSASTRPPSRRTSSAGSATSDRPIRKSPEVGVALPVEAGCWTGQRRRGRRPAGGRTRAPTATCSTTRSAPSRVQRSRLAPSRARRLPPRR